MNALKVLAALYNESHEQHYGLSLSRATKIGNGTLYPILDKLEEANLIKATWEDIDPSLVGRRPRRYYTLTGEGMRTFEEVRSTVMNGSAVVINHA